MILFLLNSKLALEVLPSFNLDFNYFYVLKIRNYYFLGFLLDYYPNLNRKIIKVNKVNIVDKIYFPSFSLVLQTMKELFQTFNSQQKNIYSYFYLGLEKIVSNLIDYKNLLRIEVKGIIDLELKGFKINTKNYKLYKLEHDFWQNKSFITLQLPRFRQEKIKTILRIIRKKLKKRIKYKLDYFLSINQIIEKPIQNRNNKSIVFVHKHYKNFDKDNSLFIYHDLEKLDIEDNVNKFPIWGILLYRFFDRVVLDYFPNFQFFSKFFENMFSNVIFHSYFPFYGNYKNVFRSIENDIVMDFEAIKRKLIFENYSFNDLKIILDRYKLIFFYSFYKHFSKVYCSFCGNIPYCEICGGKLVLKNDLLVCDKCRRKYQFFHCQYCGKYKWRYWTREYKKEFENYNVVFIDFLPSDFSYFNRNYTGEKIFIIDYFSLYKPFIIKELNIWYILFKIVNEIDVDNILFINSEEFTVFDYFREFIYNESEFLINRLIDLIDMEKRLHFY